MKTENTHPAGFTPGPWTVHNTIGSDTPNEFDGLTVQSEYGLVVRVQSEKYAGPHVDPENLANARLIAAAPELLEALTTVQQNLAHELRGKPHTAEIIRAALARATGGQP